MRYANITSTSKAKYPLRMTRSTSAMDLNGRISMLRKKDSTCDVTFTVGETSTKFSCHKLILAAGSQVFEAMFYGSFPEKSDILLPDVTAVGFELMLDYLYTDKVTLNSDDEAFEAAYVAKKYMIVPFFETCENHLMRQVRVGSENALLLYEEASFLDMKELKKMCLRYFSRNAKKIFRSPSFLDASMSSLEAILRLDIMDIDSECDLLEALWYWGEARCRREGLECTGQNVRKFTGGFLKHIRLLSVSAEDMDKISSGKADGVSDLTERMAMMLNIGDGCSKMAASDFSDKSRARCLTNCQRLTLPVKYHYSSSLSASFIIEHTQTATLSVTRKPVTIVGVLVALRPVPCYSPEHRTLDIEVTISNSGTGCRSWSKALLKSGADSQQKELQQELFLEDYVDVSEGGSAVVEVIAKGEGVLLTMSAGDQFVDGASGISVDFQECGSQGIVFPVKEILFI